MRENGGDFRGVLAILGIRISEFSVSLCLCGEYLLTDRRQRSTVTLIRDQLAWRSRPLLLHCRRKDEGELSSLE